jgi:hypothetical protein
MPHSRKFAEARRDLECLERHLREVESRAVRGPTPPPRVEFKYSAGEWDLVEAETRSLPRFESFKRLEVKYKGSSLRRDLESAASCLLSDPADPISLTEMVRRWVTVGQKISELEDAITDAWNAEFIRYDFGVPEDEIEKANGTLSFLHERKCEVSVNVWSLRQEMNAPTIERSARGRFFTAVLCAWEMLGGELKLASDGRSGPLPRFFFAAIGPAMGTNEPSPASLRHIVAAYRARNARIETASKAFLSDKTAMDRAAVLHASPQYARRLLADGEGL